MNRKEKEGKATERDCITPLFATEGFDNDVDIYGQSLHRGP